MRRAALTLLVVLAACSGPSGEPGTTSPEDTATTTPDGGAPDTGETGTSEPRRRLAPSTQAGIAGLYMPSEVSVGGTPISSALFIDRSCADLMVIIQAGEWSVEWEKTVPGYAADPAAGLPARQDMTWFILRGPGGLRAAGKAEQYDDSECWASIALLAMQRLEVSGPATLTGETPTLPLACSIVDGTAYWSAAYLGTEAMVFISLSFPTATGEHTLATTGGSTAVVVSLAMPGVTAEALLDAFASWTGEEVGPETLDLYPGVGSTATVTVTDPGDGSMALEFTLTNLEGAGPEATISGSGLCHPEAVGPVQIFLG